MRCNLVAGYGALAVALTLTACGGGSSGSPHCPHQQHHDDLDRGTEGFAVVFAESGIRGWANGHVAQH